MPGTISDYLENKLLDHVLKTAKYTVPANIYVGLSTADPLDDGSGLAEPSGKGYARVKCNVWDEAASRAIANTDGIVFPEATEDWGEITHFALFDAITEGEMLAHGNLSVSEIVEARQFASFAAGDIDISFNVGGVSDYLANKLLDHVFKTAEYDQPSNIYLALADETIIDETTGATISEPEGGSYERKNHNAYDASAAGASQNSGEIMFVTATASWGTVTDIALIDAAAEGNILFYAELDTPKAIGKGDTAKFSDGALDFTMS